MSVLSADQFILQPATVAGFMSELSNLEKMGKTLDFTMEFVGQLCEKEPENCAGMLDRLMEKEEQNIRDNTNRVKENIDHIPQTTVKLPSLTGPPRHLLMLALIPFFPAMLLFTASGGLAFFATAGIELISR